MLYIAVYYTVLYSTIQYYYIAVEIVIFKASQREKIRERLQKEMRKALKASEEVSERPKSFAKGFAT